MQSEELLNVQAKAARPDVKVFVYRNIVKALPWFTSVRDIINDDSFSGFFLPFKPGGSYHVPQCDNNWSPPRCSTLYHGAFNSVDGPALELQRLARRVNPT